MKDIKLTLSTDPAMRSPDIYEEARWLQEKGAIYYQLHRMPKEAITGCYVYFIRNGAMVARAKANNFEHKKLEDLGGSYTGIPSTKGGVRVEVIPPMEIAVKPVEHVGFQGFRYVKCEEQAVFQDAFKS